MTLKEKGWELIYIDEDECRDEGHLVIEQDGDVQERLERMSKKGDVVFYKNDVDAAVTQLKRIFCEEGQVQEINGRGVDVSCEESFTKKYMKEHGKCPSCQQVDSVFGVKKE